MTNRFIISLITAVFFLGGAIAAAAQPANDNFANAEVITGLQFHAQRTNMNATKESGEPNHAGNIGGKSIWFKWTAPMSRIMNITTNRSGNNLDTTMHLYTGTSLNSLTSVTFNNNISPSLLQNARSYIRFTATAGTTYYIAVDGFHNGTETPQGSILFDLQPSFPHQAAEFHERDGMTDFAVFRPSTGFWYVYDRFSGGYAQLNWGAPGDIPMVTMRSIASPTLRQVYRPSDGSWWTLAGTDFGVENYGQPGDIPVTENFNVIGSPIGANSTIAIFRPSTGMWRFQIAPGLDRDYFFGQNGDVPVPGNYSPDAVADLAVFRPSNGTWYFRKRIGEDPSGDTFSQLQFGMSGDKPVPGDYDGDGLLDPAVYRPSTGTWWVYQSSNGQAAAFQWGIAEDIPTTGDFDGDGKFDFAVYRPSTNFWYVANSESGMTTEFRFGSPGDIPVTSNNPR